MEALVNHATPWTEIEFLNLGETSARVELFDGGLLISPHGEPRHQLVVAQVANALTPAARRAGLPVLCAINLRLRPGRIPIPDLVVTEPIDLDNPIVEAASVRLDGETYREHTVVEVGDVLRLTDPVVAEIDPAALLPGR